MYIYNDYDQKLVDERVAQFRDQTRRYLQGEIPNAEFLPLRLQNGLYIQRHAPMLRIAVPYGMLSSRQMRMLAHIARQYDKNYGHFTTRQNIQFNWPRLESVPDILADLASVQMHAIQTSGNCIRNITTDEYAGVDAHEVEDPRPYCEIIRQWSTFHPEFAYLPRKFKIAVCANPAQDRAATQVHDIGVYLVRNAEGQTGFQILVGGGQGRTPVVGSVIREFLPKEHLLSYLEAILRVYNRYGRRDNKYKARIKILVKALGVEAFRDKVEAQWATLKDSPMTLPETEIERIKGAFTTPDYDESLTDETATLATQMAQSPGFKHWYRVNVKAHKKPGYAIVVLSLKKTGIAPGDTTGEQMEAVADLADEFSFGELRVSHKQNLIFADVRQRDLFTLWEKLKAWGFATANIGHITDVICCPGGDFCSLANAKSIPVAEEIQNHFEDLDYLYDIGEIDLNISGCMNACGHHHVGHIGILGVDKKGDEYYQIALGGSSGNPAAIAKILGPSFERDQVVGIIDQIVRVYIAQRYEGESFLATYNRIGIEPFREQVYGQHH